jgi:parallel beta-helix repeat protein
MTSKQTTKQEKGNLKVYQSYSDFVQNLDTSNKKRCKPIYYWLDEQDKAVPLDAGFVALGNCKNITIQNLNISNNSAAIIMYSTSNSSVSENFLANNALGISLYDCVNLSLTKNVVVDGGAGITLRESSNISISQNYLSGISLVAMRLLALVYILLILARLWLIM